MKCANSKRKFENGFTLIEVIATVIVIGILAAFFINFMGTALTDSWRSVELVSDEAEAEATLETIIVFYTSEINQDPDNALSVVKSSDFGSDVTMKYIIFNAGNEVVVDPTPSNNLKIAVEAPGRNLTTILSKSRTDSNDLPVIY
jgi:prepilin-type N-terminal cleavage/methylation domain-containing protein